MPNGCTEYIKAYAPMFFEKDHLSCQFCPLLETYSRNQCRRTGEYIIDPRITVGRYCPLIIEGKDGELHEICIGP